ncbi:hypothetical protein I3900191A7_16170 [Clostridium baratii]|uniref:hypothetical protein n=1 Tax=Clostridium baratii TaxID=1561 RepID=UPI0036F316CF
MENKFIKFNDGCGSIINVSDISVVFGYEKGEECNITFLFKSGENLTLRYPIENKEYYQKDLNYINSLTSRR